jgi:hypothetical protein
MPNDYLGIETEKEIENYLCRGDYESALAEVRKGWKTTKNATFRVWDLLSQGKGEEAINYRKENVMARDTAISLYICHKANLDKEISEILNLCITTQERQRLLTDTLVLCAKTGDISLATKLISHDPKVVVYRKQMALEEAARKGELDLVHLLCKNGANPNANKDEALKISIQEENKDLIKYFTKSSDFKNIDYYFLDSEVCKKAKSTSFRSLLECNVYLEGNNHQLLKSINDALKTIKPREHTKEIQKIMGAYPLESLEGLRSHKNKELVSLAINELNRRKSAKIGDAIGKKFRKELSLEF